VFPCAGKEPLTQHGFYDATADLEAIRRMWDRYPDAGIATPTGDGMLVLDVDDAEDLPGSGRPAIVKAEETRPKLRVVRDDWEAPSKVRVLTRPGRGRGQETPRAEP
jgi:Bifunctional DNA primase/polymerase, N-terminal